MDLKSVLGFSLKPARVDPDGLSAPPETSALSPPSHPTRTLSDLAPGSDSPSAPPAGAADGEPTAEDEAGGGSDPSTPPSVVAAAQAMRETRIETFDGADVLAASADESPGEAPGGPPASGEGDGTPAETDQADEADEADQTDQTDEGAAGEASGSEPDASPTSEEGVARDLQLVLEPSRLASLARRLREAARPLASWCGQHRTTVLAAAGSTVLASVLALALWLTDGDAETAQTDGDPETAQTDGDPETAQTDGDPETAQTTETTQATETPEAAKLAQREGPSVPARPAAALATREEAAPQTAPSTAPREEPSGVETASEDAWDSVPELPSQPCARVLGPERLHEGLDPSVALEARAIPGGVEVLVGAAAGELRALGLRVNATTLQARTVLDETLPRALLGVVPQAEGEEPGFVADRAGVGGHRSWRTLAGAPELSLSRTNRGMHLVRRTSTHRSVSLWPLEVGENASRPVIAWQNGDRFAVAFRRGGREGSIAVGWVDRRTLQRSELHALPFSKARVGKPSAAVHEKRALIAAAVRGGDEAAWRVELVSVDWSGKTRGPTPSPIEPKNGSPAQSPRVASLGDGRWLLQWTEGAAGSREVRAVTLTGDLAPQSEPLVLSPSDANAGGGLVVAVDRGLLSLFLVQRGKGYDLWGSTLACD